MSTLLSQLSKIQRELIVQKNQWNDYGKYYFRSTEDIVNALKPILETHSCNLYCTEEMEDIAGEPYVKVTAIFHHRGASLTSSAYARDGKTQGGMMAPMVTNSASSFAKKQALQHLFSIDDSAQPVPSKEEIKEREDEAQELINEQKKMDEKRISDFMDETKRAINACDTDAMLKKVYGAIYRNAKQSFDPKTLLQIEGLYRDQLSAIKENK